MKFINYQLLIKSDFVINLFGYHSRIMRLLIHHGLHFGLIIPEDSECLRQAGRGLNIPMPLNYDSTSFTVLLCLHIIVMTILYS